MGGTPLYASPEQLRGEPLDIRSDLYSLGAVLGEALSGTPLFQGTSMKEIRNRHLHGAWRMPDALEETDPVARLLRALLSVDAAERPQSAYELSGILHACGSARPEFRPDAGAERRVREPAAAQALRRRLTTGISSDPKPVA